MALWTSGWSSSEVPFPDGPRNADRHRKPKNSFTKAASPVKSDSLIMLPFFPRALGILVQSPSENGFMEPKYYAEEVIGHPNHHDKVSKIVWKKDLICTSSQHLVKIANKHLGKKKNRHIDIFCDFVPGGRTRSVQTFDYQTLGFLSIAHRTLVAALRVLLLPCCHHGSVFMGSTRICRSTLPLRTWWLPDFPSMRCLRVWGMLQPFWWRVNLYRTSRGNSLGKPQPTWQCIKLYILCSRHLRLGRRSHPTWWPWHVLMTDDIHLHWKKPVKHVFLSNAWRTNELGDGPWPLTLWKSVEVSQPNDALVKFTQKHHPWHQMASNGIGNQGTHLWTSPRPCLALPRCKMNCKLMELVANSALHMRLDSLVSSWDFRFRMFRGSSNNELINRIEPHEKILE